MGYRCLGACIMPGLSNFAAVPVLLRSSMIHVPSSWRCPWQYYYVTPNSFHCSRWYRGGRHKSEAAALAETSLKQGGANIAELPKRFPGRVPPFALRLKAAASGRGRNWNWGKRLCLGPAQAVALHSTSPYPCGCGNRRSSGGLGIPHLER
jgi:hypothetical protein